MAMPTRFSRPPPAKPSTMSSEMCSDSSTIERSDVAVSIALDFIVVSPPVHLADPISYELSVRETFLRSTPSRRHSKRSRSQSTDNLVRSFTLDADYLVRGCSARAGGLLNPSERARRPKHQTPAPGSAREKSRLLCAGTVRSSLIERARC